MRENQALLRSFDAVVNRLQAALDGKDAAAASLRRDHAELADGNARLGARLDRALAPPPGAGGDDALGAMLSPASSTPSSATRSASPTASPARSPISSDAPGGILLPRRRRSTPV